MKSLLVLIAISVTFGMGMTACTSTPTGPSPSIGCSAEQLVDTAAVGVFTSVDGCTNTAQMQSDIQALWGGANLCAAAQVQSQLKHIKKLGAAGPIADIVCPIAIHSIDGLISAKVPASWQCSGSGSIDAALTAACDLLPF